jgi:hypothetical protein
MTITLVQQANSSGTTSTTTTLGSNPTANNLLVIICGLNTSGQTISTVSNTAGDSFTRAGSTINDGVGEAELWYCLSTAGGANAKSIVVTQTGSGNSVRVIVCEINTSTGTWALDATANASGSSPPSGPSIVTATAIEFIAGAWHDGSALTSPTGGFTALTSSSTFNGGMYQITSSSGTFTFGGSDGGGGMWCLAGAAFKTVTGATPKGSFFPLMA